MAAERKVTFTPPPGAVPEGLAQGESFDLVCSFALEAGGTVCLTQMGDIKMPGYGAKPERKQGPYRPEAADMAASAPPAPDYG